MTLPVRALSLRLRTLLALIGATWLAACTPTTLSTSTSTRAPASSTAAANTGAGTTPSAPSAATAPALPGSAGSAAPQSVHKGPAFFDNDYAGAVAEARKSKRPLFIDAWAPWCHTCLSMREYVFPDEALKPLHDKFVWLAVDTERPDGPAFLAKYPMNGWPTLWVVDTFGDPTKETPVLKWLGSATADELVTLLTDAEAGLGSGAGGPSAPKGDKRAEASVAFLRAKRATAEGNGPAAVSSYKSALAAAPTDWPRRGALVEAYVVALAEAKDHGGCVALARAEIPRLKPGTSLANLALTGLGCARAKRDAAGQKPSGKAPIWDGDVKALAVEVRKIADDPKAPILADDRSGLYEELVATHKEMKDPAAAPLAAAWASFLDGEAAKAKSPEARVVFDAHRLGAYVELGQAERALPMLEQSEKEFPEDFNPPARLARAHLELGRHDEAIAAADRALARVYGPRELRIRSLKADILMAKGDHDGAMAALEEALRRAKTMTLPPAYARARDDMERRLETIRRTLHAPSKKGP